MFTDIIGGEGTGMAINRLKLQAIITLLATFFTISPISTFASMWANTYGGSGQDYSSSAVKTIDGGFVIAGNTYSFGNGNDDLLLLKLTPDGDIVWQKTYGGSGRETASVINQTSDGGFIVAGSTITYGFSDFDFWVLKFDAGFNILWQKYYAGASHNTPYSIQETSDGGFIIAGVNDFADSDCWILRIDSSGEVVWQNTYDRADCDDKAYSVGETSDGGYLVAGETEITSTTNIDILLLKLNSSGDLVWQKRYGGSSLDYAKSMERTSDGNYIIFGETYSYGAGSSDLLLLKIDPDNGSILWQKSYGGASIEDARSVKETQSGGLVIAGDTKSFGAGGYDGWILNLDANGNILWQKTYGGPDWDFFRYAQELPDGDFLITGNAYTNYDIWVLKINADGKIPGCSLFSDTNVIPVTTSMFPANVTLTVNPLTYPSGDTPVTPQDANLLATQECFVQQLPPTADAGDDRDVKENTVAMLDGSDSFDPDDGIETYFWEQTAGPGVTLSDSSAVQPTFTVPISAVGQTMTFSLAVTDFSGLSDSDTVVLTILANACATQPDKPVLVSPGDGASNVSLTPTLQSSSYSDLGACSTHFKTRWQISDQADFSGLTYNANTFDDTLTLHQVTKKVLEPDTTYYWRVRYTGDHGIKSEWSDAFSFTTMSDNRDGDGNGMPNDQESAPGTDINENGTADWEETNLRSMITANGTDNIGLEYSSDIVSITVETMSENEISDLTDMTGILTYGLMAFRVYTAYLGATVSFTVHLQDPAPVDAVWYKQDNVNGWYDFTPQVAFSPDRKSLTFTLTDGGIGDADGFVNGVIVDPAGLGVNVRPVTARPNTPDGSADVDQASPVFTWDAVANATHYYLCIQNQLQKSIFKQWYAAGDVDNGDGTCSVTPRIILAPGDYYWLVRTKNQYGLGDWSDKTAFTVDTDQVPPVAPALNTPTGTIAQNTPEFNWDSLSDATHYRLYIQNRFKKNIFTQWYPAGDVDNGDGTCSVTPGIVLAPGDYYWLVRAENDYGEGPVSIRLAFTVE